jgi:hypothetical protein
MKYKIIDNFLDGKKFNEMVLNIKKIPWYYNDYVTFKDNFEENCFYFTHLFYEFYQQKHIQSDFYSIINPLIEKLNPRSLIRVKGNLYTNVGYKLRNLPHVDFDYPHSGAIFYLNTNNGPTVLDQNIEISSVANRLLLFDSSLPHFSVFCDDQKTRLNININFY